MLENTETDLSSCPDLSKVGSMSFLSAHTPTNICDFKGSNHKIPHSRSLLSDFQSQGC